MPKTRSKENVLDIFLPLDHSLLLLDELHYRIEVKLFSHLQISPLSTVFILLFVFIDQHLISYSNFINKK